MKKIIGLTVAALLVIGMVGSGSWAYFSDTESSTNNSLTAGTLDLNINGGNVAVTTFSATAVAPGDSGNGSSTLANVGDFSGELDITFSAVTNTGGSSGEFGDSVGNLGAVAEIAVYLDVDQSGAWSAGDIGLKSDGTTYAFPTALDYATIDSYDSDNFDAVETMAASAADNFRVEWRVPSTAGNNIQGDSVSFNVTFTLEQAAAD